MRNGELFTGQYFHDFEQGRKSSLLAAIHGYDANAVLQTPLEELAKYFEDRFLVQPLVLKNAEIYLPEPPREESVRERVADRVWGEGFVNVDRNYISFTVHVPFDGDGSLFDLQPSSRTYNMSRQMQAFVSGNEIHLPYRLLAQDNVDLESYYNQDVSMISTNVDRLNGDIARLNAQIPALIREKLNERRGSASKSQTLIQSLKIPIKKRDDVPATYSIPDVQRKPKIIEAPKVKTYTPEPTLDAGEYENILTIIKDMALAMERSPETFAKLTEEEIRDFFLILLNGHYKGIATGETFNGVGKTDILIRHQNANPFIAECKFWKGQKKLEEAIGQLLGYVTWRDTKTSILLFNKQNDLTAVLEKAQETLKAHPNFKAEYALKSADLEGAETVFGYKFTHPSDPDKEVYLTLMAFQITQRSS